MKNVKLDNEPYDRGRIAIHDDFAASPDGKWFVDNATLVAYSKESIMWHLSMAQETVDDIIYRVMYS